MGKDRDAAYKLRLVVRCVLCNGSPLHAYLLYQEMPECAVSIPSFTCFQ